MEPIYESIWNGRDPLTGRHVQVERPTLPARSSPRRPVSLTAAQVWQQEQRRRYRDKRARGLCTKCSSPADGAVCRKCQDTVADRYHASVARGVCGVCRGRRAVPGRSACQDCLAHRRLRRDTALAAGLCGRCLKASAAPDRARCARCLQAAKKAKARAKARSVSYPAKMSTSSSVIAALPPT